MDLMVLNILDIVLSVESFLKRRSFPMEKFFGENTQRAYLMKEEIVTSTYGMEGRYPFLDKNLIQEFLWLHPDLKNNNYKSVIHNYLKLNNFF